MVEASVTAALIAAGDLPTPHPARVDTTVFGAVDLAPVAMTADQHLLAAQAAQKEAAARAVGKLAAILGALVISWTRSEAGIIVTLQSCSGTVWGAAPS